MKNLIITLLTFGTVFLIDNALNEYFKNYSFILTWLFGFTVMSILDMYDKIDKLNNKK